MKTASAVAEPVTARGGRGLRQLAAEPVGGVGAKASKVNAKRREVMQLSRGSTCIAPLTAALSVMMGLYACRQVPEDTGPDEGAIARTSRPLLTANSLVREGDAATVTTYSSVDSAALESLQDVRQQGGQVATVSLRSSTSFDINVWQLDDSFTNGTDGGVSLVVSRTYNTSGTIDRVAVTALDLTRFVVGSRVGGSLVLQLFAIENGAIFLKATATAGSMTELALTRVTQDNDASGNEVFQIATALRLTNGALKVIGWNIDSGAINRGNTDYTAPETVNALSIAATVSPHGVVTTPVITSTSAVKIIAFKIDSAANVTRGGSLTGSGSPGTPVLEIASTGVGYGRVAIATRQSNVTYATSEVRMADVTSDAKMVSWHGSSSPIDDVRNLDVVNGGGARLFVTGRTLDDNLVIKSLEAIDQLSLLDSQSAGFVSATSAAVVKASRLFSSVITSTGKVKAIAWRDYNMPLLRGQWPDTFGAPLLHGEPQDNQSTFHIDPAAQSDPDHPNGMGFSDLPDLTMGASSRFVIVGAYGKFGFYDKAGNRLPRKWSNNPTGNVTFNTLFDSVIRGTNSDGSINDQGIGRHMEFGWSCDPNQPTTTGSNVCPSEVYDTSVHFDASTDRFVLSGHIAPNVLHSDGTLHHGPPLHKYAMVAVSKTSDPRDGFYVYAGTESVYRDMPRLSTAAGMVIFTYHDARGREVESLLRPSAFLFSLADLMTSAQHIGISRLTYAQVGLGLLPAMIEGSQQPVGLVVHDDDTKRFYAFEPKSPLVGRMTIYKADSSDESNLGAYNAGPAVRFSESMSSGCQGGTPPCRMGQVYYSGNNSNSDLLLTSGSLWFYPGDHLSVSEAWVQRTIACPSPQSATFQCEHSAPAVAPGLDGGVFIGFKRWSETKTGPIPNRYPAAWYAYFSNPTATPIAAPLAEGEGDVTDDIRVDFVGSVPDPTGAGFWMINQHSNINGHIEAVAGRVMP